MTRRTFLAAASAAAGLAFAAGEPNPFGALPSARQMAWHRLETTAFLHFTVNTFTDREWGLGVEDPNVFNPARLDADAIIEPLAAAGMAGVILTATSIGPRRLIRLDRPVTAARLRLRVTEASASPMLSEFALFAEPA
jgi:hypothetical protein